MLTAAKKLFGCHVYATDGEVGRVSDIYFSDDEWKVKYLVIKLNNSIGLEVLLTPIWVWKVAPSQRRINVSLDKERVKNCPKIDDERTVSMQMTSECSNYIRWPFYWTDVGIWGTVANYPGNSRRSTFGVSSLAKKNENHLRSVREVIGYGIHSREKRTGRVEDVLIDDHIWLLDSIVARTRKWLPSKSVLIARENINSISWERGEFQTPLSYHWIRALPKYHGGVKKTV